MDEYTTKAVLTASVGQFVAAFKEAEAQYKQFNTAMKNSSMSSTDAVNKSSKLVSTGLKVGTVALVAMAAASLKTGATFEHQMSRVGAISGASKTQLKGLNDEAITLGAKTAFSAKQAAEGMESLASAGFDSKQIMSAIPGVMNLAAVSGGNVGEAAEDAATALRGFGLSASDSGHVADVFAEAAAKTNAEASDMGEALKMVAPQAHSAGLSLEETSAAIGILSNAGIKGTQAGSNLGMALTKLQNPSGEAKDAMAKIGFSAYDSAGKMKPLATQVDELKSKLSGMTDKQKQYYLSEIYGVQGGRAMNVLLNAQSGELQKLTGQLKNSDGAAAKMAKTMQNDLASSVEQFFGALESLSIVIEETFSGTLKSGVDAASKKVAEFTDYLKKNRTEIQQNTQKAIELASSFLKLAPSLTTVGSALKVVLPSLVALEAFKGIGAGGASTVKMLETMQADLSLVQRGLIMTGSAGKTAFSFTSGTFKTFGSALKSGVVNLNSFNNALMSEQGGAIFANKLKGIGTALTGLPGKAKSTGSALASAFTNPQVAINGFKNSAASVNQVFYKLLSTAGASDQTIAALTNTVMKNGTALGTVGRGAEGLSSGMMSGATAAAGLGVSLGALVIVAAAVAVVATAIYAAWSTNFLNIRGVVVTAISGIKSMFTSMHPSIDAIGNALKPIGKLLEGILVIVGASAISAIVIATIALATALRLVVDALGAIANTAMAAGYAMEGFIEKMIPGGKDGSAAFDKAKKSIDGAKDSVVDMGDAFVDAGKTGYDAFSQLGKSSETSSKQVKVAATSVKEVGNAAKQMKSDFESSKTKLSDLINTDGVSAKTKTFLTDVNKTLDDYQKNAQTASNNYKTAMVNAEKETGSARVQAVNEANQKLANATSKNSQNLVNITQDLDRQLKAKRFSDGTAMTQDQVNILTQQNNLIKQKLIEQNQIFTQAELSRIQNGQKLSQTEQQATITTLQSNYQLRAQQVQTGEDKIKQLKTQIAQTQDQTVKAQLQQELVQQQTQNQQLLAQQQQFGTQMNLAIANGSKLTFTTWSNGLKSMGNVTTQQLQAMFLSFMQMNNNTGQQMQAFALMLQQSGTKGVTNLVQALSTGKATTAQIAAAIAKDGTDGLNTLPPGMFKQGDKGKTSFINALKSGNFKGAGKYLADQSSSGAKDTSKHKEAGKSNGDAYASGTKSSKGKAKTAGKAVAKAGADGAKSSKSSYSSAGKSNSSSYSSGVKSNSGKAKSAGKSLASAGKSGASSKKSSYHSAGSSAGSSYASGVRSKTGSARSAGKALASAAKSGASGISFHSVGAQMAAGVASGIRSNTGSAVAAMASLVAQVNAEAKKKAKIHSPSRLLRDEVGKYLSLGVATGITDYQGTAVNAMGSMIQNIRDSVNGNPLNFKFNGSSVLSQSVVGQQAENKLALENTNQLLKALVNKSQFIVLDDGTLVGKIAGKIDDALGQNVQNTARWS
ncbi:MAG: phage tail tape measure protein [Liquorilactobacillus sp.]